MKFKGWCTALLMTIGFVTSAQDNLSAKNWKILSQIEYEKSRDDYGEIFIPKFNAEIRGLAGTEIELAGYIIPFEGLFEPDRLIISSVPIASCFFCGGAGPESVAQIHMEEPVKYTAKKVRIKGVLNLNDNNVDELMYVLKDAKLVEE